MALSKQSPIEPIDGRTPACAQRCARRGPIPRSDAGIPAGMADAFAALGILLPLFPNTINQSGARPVLQLLLQRETAARLLLLYTGRPEFRPQWALKARSIHTLGRLSSRDTHAMIGRVARRLLSDETAAAVAERSGGVPLFVEELTRAVIESGDAQTHSEIPVTLYDSLMVRLDRLGAAREVAQIASVIGREFSYDLLYALYSEAKTDSSAHWRNSPRPAWFTCAGFRRKRAIRSSMR